MQGFQPLGFIYKDESVEKTFDFFLPILRTLLNNHNEVKFDAYDVLIQLSGLIVTLGR